MIIKRQHAIPQIPVNHTGTAIKKQVYITDGSIPHITQAATATIKPHDRIPSHIHETMYECYIITSGSLDITINDEMIHLDQGDFFCIEPHERHEIINTTEENAIIFYWGSTS